MIEEHPLKAIIVDDEPHARENLKMLVNEFCPNVEVMALAENADKAERLVDELNPDLVFLDIMMPGRNGFGFLQKIEQRDFEVVFTTAHGEHALRAFQEGALHYLEKPINVDELMEAVKRVARRRASEADSAPSKDASLSEFLEQFQSGGKGKTAIATSDGLVFVDNDEIIRLEAQDQYTSIYLTEGRKMLSSRNIKNFEDKLNDKVFFRLHRSHIINMVHHLREFRRTDGGIVLLSDGTEIPVSRRKLPLFMERIQSL